jgi:glycosyltransferase involved in cell wall biosynthesis
MIIAINTSFTTGDCLNHVDDFIFENFSRLATQYPQHQFIYIFDKIIDAKYLTSKNITPVAAGRQTNNTLVLQYRLNYKIPAILRKYKADVFVSGGGYCSLRSKIPQCIVVNDLSFLQHPDFFTNSFLRFYKKNTAKFLSKAKVIVTTSQFLKHEIIDQYKIKSDKIEIAYYGINQNFKPVSWQQKDNTKEIYTEGVEYFLYSGTINTQKNLMALLKAFSFFKKRQKSNMHLVLASTNAADKILIASLATFKYRNDVKVLHNLPNETLAKITAAAYALIYPALYEGFAVSITEAMQADVPVITSRLSAMPEICGDAALYMAPNDFNDIADKMMLLFKDESKRNLFIIKGRQQANLYNWDKSADLIWKAVIKCTD